MNEMFGTVEKIKQRMSHVLNVIIARCFHDVIIERFSDFRNISSYVRMLASLQTFVTPSWFANRRK